MRPIHCSLPCGVLLAVLPWITACRGAPESAQPLEVAPPPAAVSAAAAKPQPERELPAEPPTDADRTNSGVALVVLDPGDPQSPRPRANDRLELRYRVWDGEGVLVDRSPDDGTRHLTMGWLPPGWAEAMKELHVGAHAHVWVPPQQAYASHPDAPQGMLVIDVELVSLEVLTTDVDEVPLTSVPSNALRTSTGLAFVILRAGTGTQHPQPDATVTVHYEGWTTDGKSFDSSYDRDKPTTFPLKRVIPGWQEALPLMVEGEKTRFWIPAELAYANRPSAPQGMLIFDIELIRIEP